MTAAAHAPLTASDLPRNPKIATPREQEVVKLICASKTHRQIAEALGISRRTVESHVASLTRKLAVHTFGACNRTQIVLWAHRAGLVTA